MAGEERGTGTPGPGTTFGRYRVVRKLGEGGMGIVYEARHMDLGKRVALKVLRPVFAGNPEVVGRFLREGVAVARIRHPNVVDVTDSGTAQGMPYLVMELLEGESLAARLERGALPVAELIAVMLPVCAAVSAAHACSVLHRDLKPGNIFLERTERGQVRPKVLDFGIARLFSEAQDLVTTDSAAVIGTPFYMAPEQIRGARGLDLRCDQYALGVILYECCAGDRPYSSRALMALSLEIDAGAPRSLRERCPDAPPALEAAILRAMARDPDQRFASVRELAAALLPLADDRTKMLWEGAFDGPEPTPAVEAPMLGTETTNRARSAPAVTVDLGQTGVVTDHPATLQPSSRVRTSVVLAAVAALALVCAGVVTRLAPGHPAPSLARTFDARRALVTRISVEEREAARAPAVPVADAASTAAALPVPRLATPASAGRRLRRAAPAAVGQREIPME